MWSKSFLSLSLMCAVSLLSVQSVSAYPTTRPLPRRVIDSDEDFLVFRDHREAKRFYLIPRAYRVVNETYTNIGNRDVSCDIVGSYQESDSAFASSLKERASILSEEFRLQKTELELRGKYETELAALKQRQIQLERELNRMSANPNSEIQNQMKAEVESIKESTASIMESLNRLVQNRAERKLQLDSATSNVNELEKNLKTLEGIIRQPIAKASLQIAVPLPTRAVRKRLGFQDSDDVQMPMIISSKMFPVADPLVPGQDPTGNQATGAFLPEWTGIKAYSPRPTDLTTSDLPADMHLEAIPPQVGFEQTLSVFHFCRLRSAGALPRMDIQIGIAQWEDDFNSRPRFPEMGRLLMIVEPSVWSELRDLPISTDFFQGTSVDTGDPSAFIGTKGKLIQRELMIAVKR